ATSHRKRSNRPQFTAWYVSEPMRHSRNRGASMERRTRLRHLSIAAAMFVLSCGIYAQNQVQPPTPMMHLKQCTRLPSARQMHGCAVIGTRLYTFGGAVNLTGWENSVISADILADGNLGTWREERAMPERRSYIGTSIELVNNRIYII